VLGLNHTLKIKMPTQELVPDMSEITASSEQELNPDISQYELAFKARQELVNQTLQALKMTHYGQKFATVESIGSYSEFVTTFPLVLPSRAAEDPKQFAAGDTDKLIKLYSGGTTGTQKEFYFSDEERVNASGLGEWGRIILAAEKPLVLYGEWGGIDAQVAKETTQALRPDVGVYEFKETHDAIEAIAEHDAIFMEMGVMSYKTFHYQLMEQLAARPELKQQLSGKKIMLELNSEPVTAKMLEEWYADLATIFEDEVYITVSYTQNDTGLIGLYDYVPGEAEEDVKYLVTDKRLVEVLDEDSNLVVGQEGDVVITTLRQEGSVFFRYDSSDRGVLTSGENGELYLSGIHRKAESGMISLWGRKVSVADFYQELETQVSFPFQMEVRPQLSEDNSVMELVFAIYCQSDDEGIADLKEHFWQLAEKMIAAEDDTTLAQGDVPLDVDVVIRIKRDTKSNFEKSWKLIKN